MAVYACEELKLLSRLVKNTRTKSHFITNILTRNTMKMCSGHSDQKEYPIPTKRLLCNLHSTSNLNFAIN